MSDTLLHHSSFIGSKRNRQKIVFFYGYYAFQLNKAFLNHEKILKRKVVFIKNLLAFGINLRSSELRYLINLVVMKNLNEIHVREENRHFIVLPLPKYLGCLIELLSVNF